MTVILTQDVDALKKLALSKNYSINRGFPLTYFLLDKSTGATVAALPTLDAMAELLDRIEPAAIPELIEQVSVGWQIAPQVCAPLPRQCANCGSDCFSLLFDDYLCGFGCHGPDYKAECRGVCQPHFAVAKLFANDYAEDAIRHTQSHENDGTLKEAQTVNSYKNLKHTVIGMIDTSGQTFDRTRLKELLGIQIRQIAGGHYQILNKDALILAQDPDPNKLLSMFLLED